MIPLSLHDRSHLTTEINSRAALLRTINRAQRAEVLGYSRFWTAEHHGIPGVAGSAPAVLLAAIGHATSRIRIGAGGVMLPNHQPLVVAEQFSILEALFPGRVDLGLGRSLGFVRPVREALRREQYSIEEMADDIAELTSFLLGQGSVTLMPAVAPVPLFILATGRGAEMAGRAGLPLVVGGPNLFKQDDAGKTAIDRYRDVFRPSPFATDPFVILNLTAIAADTGPEAENLARSEAWAYVNSKIAGAFLPLESPADTAERVISKRQRDRLPGIAANTIAGTAQSVFEQVSVLYQQTEANEVMLSGCVFGHGAALHSDELLAKQFGLGPFTPPSRK